MKSESIINYSPYGNSKCTALDLNKHSLSYVKNTRQSTLTKAFLEEIRHFGKESDISNSSQSTYFISQKIFNFNKAFDTVVACHENLHNDSFYSLISIGELSDPSEEENIDRNMVKVCITKQHVYAENSKILSQGMSKIFKEDQEDLKFKVNLDIDSQRQSDEDEIKKFKEYNIECLKMKKSFTIIPCEKTENFKIDLGIEIINQITCGNKKLAIFDLEETLVHLEYEDLEDFDKVIEINSNKIGINFRPHLLESLRTIGKHYVMVAFTSSQKIVADSVLDLIDLNYEIFKRRLYIENCLMAHYDGQNVYVKDLQIFNSVPLQKIVIIDNSVYSFLNNINNGIPILPFFKNKEDKELLNVVDHLNLLTNAQDVRIENKKIIGLGNYITDNEFNSSSSFSSDSDDDVIILDKSVYENRNFNNLHKIRLNIQFNNNNFENNQGNNLYKSTNFINNLYLTNSEFSHSETKIREVKHEILFR